MSLSNDLISQFVKVTNDTEKTKSDTTVYGTIVEYEGSTYVKLDGSDRLTPMSTTTDAVSGERVTVMIKNHTATVTGNISSPAARTDTVEELGNQISEFEIIIADKVSTKEFDAEVGRIDTLVSDNVTIKETLTAQEADIETLNTDVANIKEAQIDRAEIEELVADKVEAEIADLEFATVEDLNATNAKVNNLEVTYGDFEVLTTQNFEAVNADISELETNKLSASDASITYAKISDLNATNANVSTLDAEIGDINTLIFGSASGSTIQTSFANAVIAQLGNAQIKSAMIESIAADKITTGDIITNNVRVMSEDGKLLISDETIQISDESRVRVQIGKDSTGDYSINIWDTDGNLMFSEGGITDNAIKEAIIRNDMVSDNADISATKLNIDSLFAVINEDGSNTLNSSKIYVDTEKQTLDVAFQSMTTKVSTVTTTASQALTNAANAQTTADTAKTNAATAQNTADNALSKANENESDISTLTETVTTQGTSISVIQGQIESKIWQQDITTATNSLGEEIDTLSTQQSTLSQDLNSLSATVSGHTTQIANKADSSEVTEVSDRVADVELSLNGFKTSVSETYATKSALATTNSNVTTAQNTADAAQDDVDNLSVGCRNLLLKSDALVMNNDYCLASYTPSSPLVAGEEYTVSMCVTPASGITRIALYLSSGYQNPCALIPSGTEKQILTETFIASYYGDRTPDDNMQYALVQFYRFPNDGTVTDNTEVHWVKIEKGNKATDWTPAPEDTNELINNSYVETMSQFEITANGIKSSVEECVKSSDHEDDINTLRSLINQNSDSITINIEAINKKANADDVSSLINKINTYFSFESDGLTIGKIDNPYKMVLDNDHLSLRIGDIEILWLDAETKSAHLPYLTVSDKFALLGYSIALDDDGNMNCDYVGG